MSTKLVKLDVREEIRQQREPFPLIMRAVMQLRPNEGLQLIAPFEPVPLYAIMANRGFSHTAHALASGDYEVLFERTGEAVADSGQAIPPACPGRPIKTVEVDARGLEPPQPMVTILETLEKLPAGAELRARTDRQPMHLLSLLEQRGCQAKCEKQPDGSYVTQIQRH